MRKVARACTALLAAACLFPAPVAAAQPAAREPYSNYCNTYSTEMNTGVYPYAEPQAYTPERVLTGASLGTTGLSGPADVHVGSDGRIFISDSGNNRILVLTAQFQLEKILSSFLWQGESQSFSSPRGLYVDSAGDLFVADAGNARVVRLDKEGVCRAVYTAPVHKLIPADYAYKPLQVVTDPSGRLYVISEGENQGILQFDREGNFENFFGAIETATPGLVTAFWNMLMTREQKERNLSWIPTEYSGMDIDADGFIYGTVSATEDTANFIRELNPLGRNILQFDEERPPCGDEYISMESGKPGYSKLVDVAVGEFGIYSVLDQQRGRVFTYDATGNRLFNFGGYGDQVGTFGQPVALDVTADWKVLVVDAKYNQVVVFSPTAYAHKILTAVVAQHERNYVEAQEAWAAVMEDSVKSDMPYIGMGRVLMRQKDYDEAARYFRLARNVDYYSEDFKLLRQDAMARHFPLIISGILLAAAALVVWAVWRGRKRRRAVEKE